ncbi:MAG: cell division protein ZapA [Chitinophagaceae bacterium]
MPETVPINILIGDRSYRVRIDPKDEEAVRKAVKQINDKLVEFKTQFAGKDMQDYVAMVLVWFATLPQDQSSNQLIQSEFQSKLESLENTLDQALKN